ncbi:MAG: DUF1987 domain-containing protein [Bacteroidia bacterium]|nr:DUF1987 domain-containing protein [Bacteroidia bacterium]
MKDLNIKGDADSPTIELDKQAGALEISGNSAPENPTSYYQPITDWLNNYTNNPFPKLTVKFKYVYYNTATSIMILKIIQMLDELNEKGHEVKIDWYCEEYDEGMQESGEIFAEILEHAEMEVIVYKDI